MLHAVPSRPDLADPELARRWRDLAAGASAFLSWEWVGCRAAARYPDPVLIEVSEDNTQIGMALFNHRRDRWGGTLHMHESGDPALDAVFIEHNGVLAVPGRAAEVAAAAFACALRLASRVVLSGIDDTGLAAARATGTLGRMQSRAAPYVELGAGGTLLPLLSRNTRAQLRRSERSYPGPIRAEAAATVEQGLDWLARLLTLHVATWSGRGVASGFAAEPVQAFHQALVRRGLPTGVVQLLRVSAGEGVVGYLLNLRAGGGVAAYQSGFDYAAAGPQGKPGLTCHAAAIATAWASGADEYDFLAGDSRYKRSLATSVRQLHWVELCRSGSVAALRARMRTVLSRLRSLAQNAGIGG